MKTDELRKRRKEIVDVYKDCICEIDEAIEKSVFRDQMADFAKQMMIAREELVKAGFKEKDANMFMATIIKGSIK